LAARAGEDRSERAQRCGRHAARTDAPARRAASRRRSAAARATRPRPAAVRVRCVLAARSRARVGRA
jgi:hypothetical protein